MDLIDFIKQLLKAADKHLKRRHFAALSTLFFMLYVFSSVPTTTESLIHESEGDAIEVAEVNEVNEVNEVSPIEPNEDFLIFQELEKSEFEIAPLETLLTATPSIVLEAKSEPNFITEVKAGDNLSLIFTRAGLSAQDVYNISNSGEDASILSRLYPGYTLAFNIGDDNKLKQLEVFKNPLESYIFTSSNSSNFDTEHVLRKPNIEQTFKEAEIQDSLFLAAQHGGISAPITMEIAGIFGGVIDFLLDTRSGDTFNVLYEDEYLSGEYIGSGAILATQFTNQGETFTALRYENEAGDIGYYNPEGESMRKAFLRNPIDYVRISDGFNPSRRHPILNTIRAHRGTDYAAPRGTPIVATSDGRVTWAARNGSFGKLVVIQHGERFQTKYAHMENYARGIKNGARVNQGQIIGYVGTTGSSTGPHLHYEFLMDGVHRNSRTIHESLPKAESIEPEEMLRFHEQTSSILARLQIYNHPATSTAALAQNTTTSN